MRRLLQATLCSAVLVGCQQPIGFIDSFTPTHFVPAAEQPLTSQLKAIRAIQPGMPIQEVEALLWDEDFTCAYNPDAKPEPYLDACASQQATHSRDCLCSFACITKRAGLRAGKSKDRCQSGANGSSTQRGREMPFCGPS